MNSKELKEEFDNLFKFIKLGGVTVEEIPDSERELHEMGIAAIRIEGMTIWTNDGVEFNACLEIYIPPTYLDPPDTDIAWDLEGKPLHAVVDKVIETVIAVSIEAWNEQRFSEEMLRDQEAMDKEIANESA